MYSTFSSVDAEPDEDCEQTIELSASEKVGAIRRKLGFDESTPLKLLKQCEEIGFEVGVCIFHYYFHLS